MKTLNEAGVKFSSGDLGHSYLQYLKRTALDQFKISQRFVRDITMDDSVKKFVRTHTAIAQSLGMGAIAEGVETEEQRQFLLENGCIHFQGYPSGKLAPIVQFDALVKQF